MDQANTTGVDDTEDKALEGISVAPPAPGEGGAGEPGGRPTTEIREGADADSDEALKRDPSDSDAKLDVALDESFPGSDAPSNTRAGSGEPAPSSGYDEAAEKAREKH